MIVLDLGAAAALALCAHLIGGAALRRAGLDDGEEAALAVALGLGILAQGAFAIGLLGGFRPAVLLVALAATAVAAGRRGRAVRSVRLFAGALRRRGWIALPLLVWALYPPMGWDATAYHLPYVRSFLEAGRPIFVEHLRYPVFPQVTETLFLLATTLAGGSAAGGGAGIAAKLTQTISLLTTAALLARWGQALLSPRVGAWAAALWLGTPLAVWLGTLAYVDVQLTLFTVAAFYCYQRFDALEAELPGARRSRWLILAGLLAGLAAGVKYLGLFFCAALGVMCVKRQLPHRSVRQAAIFSLAAIFAFGPWYTRIAWHTGNPVFPFYAPLFGESEWTTRHDRVVFGDSGAAASGSAGPGAASVESAGGSGGGPPQLERLAGGLTLLARLPWSGVFERENFFSVAPLTPWYMLLLPLTVPVVLVVRRRSRESRRVRSLLTVTGLYALFWLTIEHDMRFLLPVMPLLNLAIAQGLEGLGAWIRRPAAARLVAVAWIAPGLLYCALKIHRLGPLPLSAQTRDDLLEERIDGYGGVRWLNARRGENAVVFGLYTSRLRHYVQGRLLGDAWGPMAYRWVAEKVPDPRALDAKLEDLGACYLLADRRFLPAYFGATEGYGRFFTAEWSTPTHLLLSRCPEPDRAPAGEGPSSESAAATGRPATRP
ncbi:MAG: phospholipid carrier-dependent glycosyltransferase [Acidobacteriota bacterium]